MSMNAEQKEVSKHYGVVIRLPLTDQQRIDGIVEFKIDPYRILKAYQINNAAVEHIVKKGLRWTSKGDEPRKVLNEIIATAKRELEIMDESLLIPGRSLDDILKGRDSTQVEKQGFNAAPPNSARWHVAFNWAVDHITNWGVDPAPDGWYWLGYTLTSITSNLSSETIERELWEEAKAKGTLNVPDTNGLLGNDPRI